MWVSICITFIKLKKKFKNPKTLVSNVILKPCLCFKNRDRKTNLKKTVESESKATTWIRRRSGKKRCVVIHQCLVFLMYYQDTLSINHVCNMFK